MFKICDIAYIMCSKKKMYYMFIKSIQSQSSSAHSKPNSDYNTVYIIFIARPSERLIVQHNIFPFYGFNSTLILMSSSFSSKQ